MADKDYLNYELADFLADEDFKRWKVSTTADPALDRHWEEVQQAFPHKVAIMAEAGSMVGVLKQLPVLSDKADQARIWEQINARIDSHENQFVLERSNGKWFRFAWKYAAAVVLLAMLVLGADYYTHQQTAYYLTGNGQDTLLKLPDGSEVMLGANSLLGYHPGQAREIWLSGEAYFNVVAAAQNHFTVHIGDSIDVQVLGTAFLVKNRRGKTSISLDNGMVQVQMKGAPAHQLKPGETLTALTAQQTLTKSVTAPLQTRRWQEHTMVLHETPVSEIIHMMADNYNRQLIITDTVLLHKKVDGVLPANNEQQALQALSSILGTDIILQDNNIHLKIRQ